ncbi:MAG: 4Fe-4S dicluster domain-containing protein [Deltaproteobacteria bacterium]|nr:4Fe-4S dicluster domain-containing protein [Deltaproteobacteria bacterium]
MQRKIIRPLLTCRAVRLRHRFNRKFNYLTGRFGALFCTGCGRCSRACLMKITISGSDK